MRHKVSLVLSGGGARGIAHIGVIEALEEYGYDIVSVAGTSMGALVGGIYATGEIQAYKEWMISLDRRKVFSLVDFTLSRQGLVKGDRVFKKMKDFIPDKKIEELEIPYAAVAVDLINKKEVVFREGSLYDAIRASVSIPTVFTPIKTEHGLLVDGGVLNNIPVKYVKRIPGDILVVVNVNADIPVDKPEISREEHKERQTVYQKKIHEFNAQLHKILPLPVSHEEKLGYFNLMSKTISLMTQHIAQMTLEQYSPDMLIEISRDSCGTYDFYRAAEMVEMGKHVAVRCLEKQ